MRIADPGYNAQIQWYGAEHQFLIRFVLASPGKNIPRTVFVAAVI